MAHPLYGPELRLMLDEDALDALDALAAELHPSTIAETLAEDSFTTDEVWKVLGRMGLSEQADVFEYFELDWQRRLAVGASRPHMAKLIEKMSHDDRVKLLRKLSPAVAEGLVRLVDEADRRDIAELFRYADRTVGAIMTTDYAWLPEHLTVEQAIERLRQQAPDRETIYYVYVLDEATRQLHGVVSLRDLVLGDRSTVLSEIMYTDLTALKVTDAQELAAEQLAKYDFLALPVTDDDGRLVGIVTHDDVIDVITQEATKDLQQQAGVGPLNESYFEASYYKIWKSRALWLAALFVAQMFTLTAIEQFNETIQQVIVLAMFMPLCISVGGNAGSQAATLITRALALDQVRLKDWFRVFRRELVIGVMLSGTLCVLGFVRTWFLTSPHLLGSTSLIGLTYTISLSVAAICMWGTMIGSLLPLGFRRLGIDPAIASSPFIATLSDVTGIIIYFRVAKLFLL